jgi:hypothetical protein
VLGLSLPFLALLEKLFLSFIFCAINQWSFPAFHDACMPFMHCEILIKQVEILA